MSRDFKSTEVSAIRLVPIILHHYTYLLLGTALKQLCADDSFCLNLILIDRLKHSHDLPIDMLA